VRLRDQARARGFDVCRITHPGAIPEAPERLGAWLASGAAGSMDWLAATQARRSDPRKLWPETASIIMLGMNYRPEMSPFTRETAIIMTLSREGSSCSLRGSSRKPREPE
jgi:epoxyqueuosine reductase QueG